MKQSVAESMMKLFESGFMAIEDFDERAVEMMNSFPEDQARYIVDQLRVCQLLFKVVFVYYSLVPLFKESRLYGVQNKPQYLMSLMRNFRDRIRAQGAQAVMAGKLINGPDPDKMTEILNRTGYTLEITVGQRKYGGPCPDWDGPPTGPAGQGHEVRFKCSVLIEVFLRRLLFFRFTSATFHTNCSRIPSCHCLKRAEKSGIYDS